MRYLDGVGGPWSTMPFFSAYSNSTSITCLDNDRIRRSASGWKMSASCAGIAMITRGLCRSTSTGLAGFVLRLRAGITQNLALDAIIVNLSLYVYYTYNYFVYSVSKLQTKVLTSGLHKSTIST